MFSPPSFTKIPHLPDLVGSGREQLSQANVVLLMSQERQEAHRYDKKRLKVSMLNIVVITVWTHNKRFFKVSNRTYTPKITLKKSVHPEQYTV